MHRIRLILLIAGILVLGGCVTPPPPATYVETAEPEWKVISLRDNLSYDNAWQMLVDHMKKEYDIETLDKNSGQLRTDWIFKTDENDYKVRITAKFSADKKKLELKTDSLYHKVYKGSLTGTVYEDYGWIPGSDTKVLDEAYGEISALLGKGM
jgi:PBP1b-binding outer membrane lipoprotein LpoB